MNWSKTLTSTKKYILISILFLSFFTFVFAKFADELVEADLFHFDQTIINWIGTFVKPQLTSMMKFFTFFGSPLALILFLIISVSWMVWQKKRWESLFLVIAIAGGGLFNQLLKWIFHRQRPTLHRLIQETGYSFPSGHSMISFVFYGMICMLLMVFLKSRTPKVIVIISTVIMVVMVGMSRIYLGVHYPSDVLAGYAAGGAWLMICLIGLRLVLETREKNRGEKN
ncbi:phosphatase PAP2 family protein [Shimazuella sp. AN120528]|uniref:phosphatase PAP2 family protein n=1 Tax=Shimazuella soli TaxID=1892854 RepID=UPI001F115C40|nr:phosphatase PAP2 family protein [Shimazuella soli]MCH5586089.1 phosphatase PAP2 family protein [Shimazuella soli]